MMLCEVFMKLCESITIEFLRSFLTFTLSLFLLARLAIAKSQKSTKSIAPYWVLFGLLLSGLLLFVLLAFILWPFGSQRVLDRSDLFDVYEDFELDDIPEKAMMNLSVDGRATFAKFLDFDYSKFSLKFQHFNTSGYIIDRDNLEIVIVKYCLNHFT